MAPNSWQFSARNDGIVVRGVHDVAIDTSAETRKLKDKLDALVNMATQLAVNQKPASVAGVSDIRLSNDHHTSQFSARNDAIVIRRVHDVATDTSDETRKLEGKLDALVNLVTQLAANQKLASVARVCGIRSSNDHHISQFSGRNDVIVIRGVHDVATEISAETRKLEGKLYALVNLVTQLAANQKPATVARVCGIRSSNDHHTSVCPSSQQFGVMSILRLIPIPDHHSSRDKALDKEYGPKLLTQFNARNDAIVIRGVHDVATDTSAKTRKLEGKLDALVNLVTLLAANPKPASVAKFSERNDVIVIRGVHDVATDTSVETRKLEGKLDALVNLVTQLAANQKPASIARVCGIRFSNDHHTSQFSARNDAIVLRAVHDVATDTSAETRKLEGKLDALVNLVIQLAANQKPASVARVCGIRSTIDHYTSQFSTRNDAIIIRGVHDVSTDTSAETKKLEAKLNALANLVTLLAANQKPASVARICGNLEWMSILRLMLQTPITDHHSSRGKAPDREKGSQLLAVQCKK
ncbi:hypothetical protein Fmac_028694 [Flemingia macrophylla]|uniref:Uncharacterized protein n=1 Tax=Flemingia macrophylla TaxID=520843 RepID=A0ABD1L871_9FABA